MGGCCCRIDDSKVDDEEEKCMIESEKVHPSTKKEYGSLSTVEDKGELYSQEQDNSTPHKCHEKRCSDEDIIKESDISSSEELPPSEAKHIEISVQETPESQDDDWKLHVHAADGTVAADKVHDVDDIKENENVEEPEDDVEEAEDMNEADEVNKAEEGKEADADEKRVDKDSDSSSSSSSTSSSSSSSSDDQSHVDEEIDQLVAAAMATKVIYPPSTIPCEPSSPHGSSSPKPSPHSQASTGHKAEDEEGSDQEGAETRPLSLMKKTQLSFKKAKAKASNMISSSPKKSDDGEDVKKKKWSSLHGSKTARPVSKKTSLDETHSQKKQHQEATSNAPTKSSFLSRRKKRADVPAQERMKSRYAKGRVAQFEEEREAKEKLASHRATVDPRKAALERGERLGQLDDATEEMRDQSSSFAQTARRLREEQKHKSSSFPW